MADMWEARIAQEYAERLAELHVNLDSIHDRLLRLRTRIHRAERARELAKTRLRGAYEPNDEPVSSFEMCH